MQELSADEISNLEEIYIDFTAMINLLEAWNNKENKVEVMFILEKMKSRLKDFNHLLKRWN